MRGQRKQSPQNPPQRSAARNAALDRDAELRYNEQDNQPHDAAPLAQLDRASGYEPEGREFESLRAHHLFLINSNAGLSKGRGYSSRLLLRDCYSRYAFRGLRISSR